MERKCRVQSILPSCCLMWMRCRAVDFADAQRSVPSDAKYCTSLCPSKCCNNILGVCLGLLVLINEFGMFTWSCLPPMHQFHCCFQHLCSSLHCIWANSCLWSSVWADLYSRMSEQKNTSNLNKESVFQLILVCSLSAESPPCPILTRTQSLIYTSQAAAAWRRAALSFLVGACAPPRAKQWVPGLQLVGSISDSRDTSLFRDASLFKGYFPVPLSSHLGQARVWIAAGNAQGTAECAPAPGDASFCHCFGGCTLLQSPPRVCSTVQALLWGQLCWIYLQGRKPVLWGCLGQRGSSCCLNCLFLRDMLEIVAK